MSRFTGLVRLGARALRSPQGKRIGASAVDRMAGAANRVAGDAHAARIEKARAAAQDGLRRI